MAFVQSESADQQNQSTELVALAGAGNANALCLLWEQNRGLIRSMVWRWYSKHKAAADAHGFTADDFEQEGFFAIQYAASNYNPQRGSFTACLDWAIKRQISTLMRGTHVRMIRLTYVYITIFLTFSPAQSRQIMILYYHYKGLEGAFMAEERRIPAPEGVEEIKQHGTALFHFNIYPCTIPRDFPTVPLHWHRSMEIVYVKKGLGAVQYGLESRTAAAGDVLIVPPGTLHALFEIPGSSMEYENIIFDVDLLGGGPTDVCDQEYLVPLVAGRLLGPVYLTAEAEAYADICACLQDAEALCNFRRRGYELGVKAAMMRLLYLLMLHYPQPPEVETPDTERLKRVVALIEERYAEPLTVAAVARDCGYSCSHFMRWFRQMTGSSFVAYLIGRRLTFAAEALCESDDTILSIAQSVGFGNLSNFNRQFKARYRVTPREYRAASKPQSGGGEK